MERKILYIINPISGTRNKQLLKKKITLLTNECNIAFEIIDTREDGDYSLLKEKIKLEKITDIVIAGGDGTVNQITGSLLNTDVRIGIIPMGSGNGLAYAAGIPNNINKSLQIVFNGEAEPCDGFMVNNKFGCMLAGLGYDAKVATDFLHQKKRGLMTYLRLCLINYFKAPHYSISIQIGDRVISKKILFISIANSNQFGNHVTIAPKASLNDGLLDVVLVPQKNKLLTTLSLLWQIGRGTIKTHKELSETNNRILYFQCSEIFVDNPQRAPLHVDGEPKETASAIHFKIIPNAFRLIRP